ncbi:MAG: hypothetical protein E7261_06915 [Lachnospiraceae bacterium]|nr:hypothetical protein [Lachnospiraceae bacterium]
MELANLFQFAADNSLEMIMVFNDFGMIVYANKRAKELTEFEEDLCGTLVSDVYPGLFSKGVRIKDSDVTLGEIYDSMAYRKNKTCFQTRVKVLEYDMQYICVARDTSKRISLEKKLVLAEQEAKEALKVKSEFVANVTHELRTPVNGILGNTRELISRESDEDKLKLLALVERGCRDMNAIINNILDFSKLEAGKFILEERKFEFRNMIDYVKSNHINRITEKGLEFSITVSPEVPKFVVGDELRIVQILNNMISNAYKFTSVGEIHVEIVKTAQMDAKTELFFVVIDTGIGIAKADQDKLFKSFSQVDASISRKYGGTGLGLSICKELVELMGGGIHVNSEVGKGTVFSFNIWVEIPEEDYLIQGRELHDGLKEYVTEPDERQTIINKLQNLMNNDSGDGIKIFGEPANLEELEKKLTKLILSMEMDNWEKAEMFAESIKELAEEAPREIKSAALRLKMAVQKGDYEKAVAAFELFKNSLQQI